jgi:hypothetical protein
MKKRPKITTTSPPSPEGVKRTSTQLTYESKSGNIYKGKVVETTSITSDTPNAAARLKEISPIGYTADDQLIKMEKVAKICLGEAGIPTEIQETYDPKNKRTEQKTPMLLAEEKYGKYSDEYYAGKMLLHIAVVRNENNVVDTRISSAITATNCFHRFTHDTYAYLVGLSRTKTPVLDDWVKRAEKIMDDNGWIADDVINSQFREVSSNKLANMIVEKNESVDKIAKALRKYFKSII